MNKIFLLLIFSLPVISSFASDEDPSKELFDGETLSGWACVSGAPITGWKAQDQELVSSPDARGLVTLEKYTDFDFECDFQLDSKGIGGIYLRGRYEIQLLDDPSYPKIAENEKCGAIFRQVAPSKSAYQPSQWNNLKVRLVGRTVTVKLNDKTIIERKQIQQVSRGAINLNEDSPGPILLQTESSTIRFKNLKIAILKD